MLVGQDWGCPDDGGMNARTVQNVENINRGGNAHYLDNDSIFETDRRLIELFKSIGDRDIKRKDYPDLFFTNLILGYQTKNNSAPIKTAWIEECGPLFKELMEIIEPKIILCLGKVTAIGVLNALGTSVPANLKTGTFNGFIGSSENPIQIHYGAEDMTARVFALAHCGKRGTLNRNKEDGKSSDSLEIQRGDWGKIGTLCESLV